MSVTDIMKGLSWNNSLAIQGFYSRTFPDRPIREQFVPLPHKFEDGDSLWVADAEYVDSFVQMPFTAQASKIPTNCKNCGAPLKTKTLCAYCGTMYM
jgi:hypothetical protein